MSNENTVIRTENGWHIDRNNNRWNADDYTFEQAAALSKTLINCIDCSNCKYCRNCHWCGNCESCAGCIDCISCISCNYCHSSTYCSDCHSCNYCHHCNSCGECYFSGSCSECLYCSSCSSCVSCISCNSCDSCRSCTYCRHCHGYVENPQRIFGWKMGSRDDIPVVYWLEPGKEQCVVGCFRGTLDQLEEKVKETHKNNQEHLNNYLKFIKNVRAYQEMCKDEE